MGTTTKILLSYTALYVAALPLQIVLNDVKVA